MQEVISAFKPEERESDSYTLLTEEDDTEEYIKKFTPRIKDVPWSAPVYDEVVEIKSFPRPQCVLWHSGKYSGQCRCFSQQATPLSVNQNMCVEIVNSGYFEPYRKDLEDFERDG